MPITEFRGEYDVPVLSKVDIAALAKADSVTFEHHDGQSYIRATKDARKTERDPFADDIRYKVPAEFELVNYESDDMDSARNGAVGWLKGDEFTAYHMIHTPSVDTWQTVCKLLHAGDTLRLRWIRGGKTTDGLRDAQYVGDSLVLCITRPGKKGAEFFAIPIADVVCPRYSAARMIWKRR